MRELSAGARNANGVATSPGDSALLRAGVGRFFEDRTEAKVTEARERLGFAEHATSWQKVLMRDDIDVVDICTPVRRGSRQLKGGIK